MQRTLRVTVLIVVLPLAFALVLLASTVALLLMLPQVEPLAGERLAGISTAAVDRVEDRMICLDTLQIVDGSGREAGLVRRALRSDCDRVAFSAPFEPEVAMRIAKAFGQLEGAWTRSSRTFLGHDLIVYLVAALSKAEGALLGRVQKDADGTWRWSVFPPRGSGPILTVFESLSGDPEAIGSTLEKAENLRDAALFSARHLPDDRARAHFIAQSLPVIAVDGGRELGGAHAAGHLFGGAPEGWGETCLFAALSGFPLDMRSHRRDLPTFAEREERARARAAACVEALAPAEEREAALDILKGWTLPSHAVPVLALAMVPPVLEARALPATEEDDRLALTVRVEVQAAAREALRPRLNRIEDRLAAGQCFGRGCSAQAAYTIAVAEIEGERLPLRLLDASHTGALFGRYDGPPGARSAVAPDFGLASQHKTLLVLLAARHGEDVLCNREIAGLSNVSGPEPVAACEGASGRISLEEAIARSMNTPFADLAIRRTQEARALEEVLGFLGAASEPGAIALGQGRTAPPERFMALMATLDRAKRGASARTEGLSLLAGHPAQAVDLAALGLDGDAAHRAALAMAAPLDHPAGTLRPLARALRDAGFVPGIGKSGTGETPDGAARHRGFTATAGRDGRRFVVHVSVSSRDGRTKLGAVPTADLADLAVAALKAVTGG
jgi:hypothetical protein